MSEYWIVCGCKHQKHQDEIAAERERDGLSAHLPDKTFEIHRCKTFRHSANHFTRMADLLRDILDHGLTRENRDAGEVLLTTLGNRTPKFKTLSMPRHPLPLADVEAPR